MRLTIIKDDDFVAVDGEGYFKTGMCADLPVDFHALQWDGTSGEVEYRMVRCAHCDGRSRKPNAAISGIAMYQPYVDRWRAAKAEYAAALEAARLAAEAAHAARPEA